jgi:hypothetical protein
MRSISISKRNAVRFGLRLFLAAQMAIFCHGQRMLPSPGTQLGGQLIFFYEDGPNLSLSGGSRGSWQSGLQITNHSLRIAVNVHYQFYSVVDPNSCKQVIDFVDLLAAGKDYIFNPSHLLRPSDNAPVRSVTGGRFLMVATPVNGPNDLRAIPFNFLGGQIMVKDSAGSSNWSLSAPSRLAVDGLGSPLYPTYTSPATTTQVLDGTNRLLQVFQPAYLSVNFFAPPPAVTQNVPFGNRLTFVSISDNYNAGTALPGYSLGSASVTLYSFLFANGEAYSVPARSATCVSEFVVAPNFNSPAGNFPDFLTSILGITARSGGWLRMRITGYSTNTSLLGWFSQTTQFFKSAVILNGSPN